MSYSLVDPVLKQVLRELEVPERKTDVDMLASDRNYPEPIYCTRKKLPWRYNWGELKNSDDFFCGLTGHSANYRKLLPSCALNLPK